MTFASYPIKETSFIYARERAKEESLDHPDHFIYLLRSNSGYYLIDHIGLKHSDEKIIFTFKNGEKTL